MGPTATPQDSPADPHRKRGSPEARAERHASRAGATYARFLRNIANAGGYTMEDAERYAIGVVATLEERLPIREVDHLEAHLPSRLDELLSSEPLVGLPTMSRHQFGERIAHRLGVPQAQALAIAVVVLGVLRSRISVGEANHVEAQLPEDLRSLWRQPAG